MAINLKVKSINLKVMAINLKVKAINLKVMAINLKVKAINLKVKSVNLKIKATISKLKCQWPLILSKCVKTYLAINTSAYLCFDKVWYFDIFWVKQCFYINTLV